MNIFYNITLSVALLFSLSRAQSGFKEEQLRNPRVRQAYVRKERTVKELFEASKLPYPPRQIYLRIFKKEMLLELWASAFPAQPLVLVKNYAVCASSGGPGPKRKRGDGQVPEGFYHINHFNPRSNFHLSLGLNYPNRSDRVLGDRRDPGSAIYIHGDCVTIGCIPITDEGIKELYLTALEARAAGQKEIPVHIFPCRMEEPGYRALLEEYRGNPGLIGFWTNLKQGYDRFETIKIIPKVKVDGAGRYNFNQP